MAWDPTKRQGKTKDEPTIVDSKFDDYWRAASVVRHDQGLKILAWGEYETGKSYFGLSFPPPIYAIDTEWGIAPVLRHFKDKEVYVFEAAVLDPDTDEPDPVKSLEKVEKAVAQLKDVTEGTILIDSGTDIWQWIQAWLERTATKRTPTGGLYRFEYGRANLRWRQLVLRLMAKPTHFVITSQTQDIYDAKGNVTGNKRPRIQKQSGHIADIILYFEKRWDKVAGKWRYMSTMEKCRFERAMNAELEDITFDSMATMLKNKLGVVIKGMKVE